MAGWPPANPINVGNGFGDGQPHPYPPPPPPPPLPPQQHFWPPFPGPAAPPFQRQGAQQPNVELVHDIPPAAPEVPAPEEQLRELTRILEESQDYHKGCWHNYRNAVQRFHQTQGDGEEGQLRGLAILIHDFREATIDLGDVERQARQLRDQLNQPATNATADHPVHQDETPLEAGDPLQRLLRDQVANNQEMIRLNLRLQDSRVRRAGLAATIELIKTQVDEAKAHVPPAASRDPHQLEIQFDSVQRLIDAKARLERNNARMVQLDASINEGDTEMAGIQARVHEINRRMLVINPPPVVPPPQPVGPPAPGQLPLSPAVRPIVEWIAGRNRTRARMRPRPQAV